LTLSKKKRKKIGGGKDLNLVKALNPKPSNLNPKAETLWSRKRETKP